MPLKNPSKKQKELESEAVVAWKWLSHNKTYIADYQRQCAGLTLEEENQLREKYKFYPLLDPKTKGVNKLCAPLDFFWALSKSFLDSGINFYDINLDDLLFLEYPTYSRANKRYYRDSIQKMKEKGYTPPAPPLELRIGINPQKPTEEIVQRLRFYLERVKAAYKVKDERPRTSKLSSAYKIHVLSEIGMSLKKIRKIVHPANETDHEGVVFQSPSRTKQFDRLAKKVLNPR